MYKKGRLCGFSDYMLYQWWSIVWLCSIFLFLWLKRRWIIIKNIGMKKIVSIVVVIISFIISVFIVFCVLELVLVLIISGITSRINVSEVIRIGCKCICIVLSVVLIRFLFFLFIKFLVNSTIRIVFFVDNLMVVSRFIWK